MDSGDKDALMWALSVVTNVPAGADVLNLGGCGCCRDKGYMGISFCTFCSVFLMNPKLLEKIKLIRNT